MSMDNYIFVSKTDGKFVVSDVCASNEAGFPLESFESLEEATKFANEQICEYGVSFDSNCFKK